VLAEKFQIHRFFRNFSRKKKRKEKMSDGLLLYGFVIGLVVLCAFLGLLFGAMSYAKLTTVCNETTQEIWISSAATLKSNSPITFVSVKIELNPTTLLEPASLLFINADGDTQPSFVIEHSPLQAQQVAINVKKLNTENVVCFGSVQLTGNERILVLANSKSLVTAV